VPLERVEPARPVLSVRGQPGVQLRQGLGAEVVDAPLGVDADADEAGVAQHSQVPGDAGLVHAGELDEFTDRTVVFTDVVENAAPGRFGDHMQYVELSDHGLSIRHSVYMSSKIW
jgi:hypothetical protein